MRDLETMRRFLSAQLEGSMNLLLKSGYCVSTRSGTDGITERLNFSVAYDNNLALRSNPILIPSLPLRVLTRKFAAAIGIVMILGLSSFATAVIAKEAVPNEDPQIEQRMKNLTEQLRCLVCQNETLADQINRPEMRVMMEIDLVQTTINGKPNGNQPNFGGRIVSSNGVIIN